MPTPELAKALAAVQRDLPAIAKGTTAKIPGRPDYKYADLAELSEAVLPLLGKNGLAFTAWPTLDDGQFVLAYALVHESGEERGGVYPLPSSGKPQEIGSAITYARRYILCAVTGVAPGGEDDDGEAVQQEVHMDRAPRPQRPPSRPTADPVRTATTGADHERLRHGTVVGTPDDRPAERTRGPVPDDQWQDVPPEEQPGSADPKDVKGIQIAYGKLKFDTRADRAQLLGISGQIVRRPLTSHNDLTFGEAQKLRHTLEGFQGDRGALMERLSGITQAVAAVGAQDAAENTQESAECPECGLPGGAHIARCSRPPLEEGTDD